MRTWFILLFLSLTFPFCAMAGDPALTVKTVRIECSKASFDETFVRAHISVKDGDVLDRALVSQDVKRLVETGRFADVKVQADEAGDNAVQLRYIVEPKPRLAEPITMSGSDYYNADDIERFCGLQPGDYASEKEVVQAALKIAEQYRKHHFVNVEVIPVTEWVGEDAAKVHFEIKEGPQAHVAAIEFRGNQGVSSSELKSFFRPRIWWNPFTWFRSRKYDETILEEGRYLAAERYRDLGYLHVQIGEPVLSHDEDGNLVVVMEIQEGVSFRYGTILLDGVKTFPESALRAAIRSRPGDVAAKSMTEASMQNLRDYYGSRGYIDTLVRPVLDPDVTGRIVNVTFMVQEGALTKIRNIRITGNTRTKDKVIRRELLVKPGDIFDEVGVRTSERRLMNLGYFSAVRSFPYETAIRDEKDLFLEVEEQSTGRVMFGAGFSSIDKASLFLELTQANFDMWNPPYFTGGGQKLQLSGELGTKRKNVNLSFVEPWFMDHKLLFGMDAYHKRVDYDEYSEKRTGGDLRIGRALGADNRVELKYGLEDLELTDFGDTNLYTTASGADFRFPEEQEYVQSTLTATFVRDRRDRTFVPTKGNRLRLSSSLSGGPLGFDTDMWGMGAGFWQFVPLWRGHVLSMMFSYETVEPYGDTDELPLAEKLYIGGGRTLRGYKYRDVGPKVTRTEDFGDGTEVVYHKPVGGNSLGMFKAEYWIPLVDKIRFAVFFDAGNVWEESFAMDPSHVATSWGAGFRFDLPGFPIRIDYADPIKKDDPLTRTEPWVFWIGTDM